MLRACELRVGRPVARGTGLVGGRWRRWRGGGRGQREGRSFGVCPQLGGAGPRQPQGGRDPGPPAAPADT